MKRTPIRLIAAATVIGSMFAVTESAVQASTTFVVDDLGTGTDTNPGDGVCATSGGACTLTAALAEANATIEAVTIQIPAGTHRLADSVALNSDVVLAGSGAGSTIIDLDGGQGFTVDRAAVEFQDLTITGASTIGDGAAIRAMSAELTLTRVVGSDNIAGDGSGGFLQANASTIHVSDSSFTDNIADRGGAFSLTDSKVSIEGSSFERNAASESGGAVWFGHPEELSISNTSFAGNAALDQGGGVYIDGFARNGPEPAITGSSFVGNHAANEGGGLFVGTTADSGIGMRLLTVSSCTFRENRAVVGGGAAVDFGRVAFVDCTFADNEATDGGGGAIGAGGDLTVSGSTFRGNVSAGSGGAIASNGIAAITGSTFIGNRAESNGGAMALVGEETPTVTGSTFTDNDAEIDAGAIWRLGADLNQSGLTHSGNTPNDVVVEEALTAETRRDPDDPEETGESDEPGGDTTTTVPDGEDPTGSDGPESDGIAGPVESVGGSGSRDGGTGGLLATTGAQITTTVLFGLLLIAAGFAIRRSLGVRPS